MLRDLYLIKQEVMPFLEKSKILSQRFYYPSLQRKYVNLSQRLLANIERQSEHFYGKE